MVADVTRAADIIDRIRSLYRRGTPHRELVDVNAVIREMIALLDATADRNSVSIRIDLRTGLPTITADRVQLQQVLMNLMLNGIEAMKDIGGVLVTSSKRTEDNQLLISVSDSGVGLPEGSERILRLSSPPSRRAPEWDWQLVAPSSSLTVAVCGRAPTQDVVPPFNSRCHLNTPARHDRRYVDPYNWARRV
jgi:hypothetical protein